MKYSWSRAMTEFKAALLANIIIKTDERAVDDVLMFDLKMKIMETDSFHPWDTDGELSRALEKMPNHCNYRSCKAMWHYRDRKEYVGDSIYGMFLESMDQIQDHYRERWNFAPGFKSPGSITTKREWEDVCTKLTPRLIRIAKEK